MKKTVLKLTTLALLLCMMLILFTACGDNAGNTADSTGENGASHADVTGNNNTTPTTPAEPSLPPIDRYVAGFASSPCLVTASGKVERLENTGDCKFMFYATDGSYCVYDSQTGHNDKDDRDVQAGYAKQGGREAVKLCDDVFSIYMQEEIGRSFFFAADGVYMYEGFDSELKKISDVGEGMTVICFSPDNNTMVYVSELRYGASLYVVDLQTCTSTKIAQHEDLYYDRRVTCVSATEIYYYTDTGYMWDGTSSKPYDEKFPEVPDADEQLVVSMGLDPDDVKAISPSRTYLVLNDGGDMYRCKITNGAVSEKTLINDISPRQRIFFVGDNGAVFYDQKERFVYYNDNAEYLSIPNCSLYTNEATLLPRGDMSWLLGNVLYYRENGVLIAHDLQTGEAIRVAQNVDKHEVQNGYCWYVTEDGVLYRADLKESLTSHYESPGNIGLVR